MNTYDITREWLQTFAECKARGEDPAASVFWRLAIYSLPEGVDGANPHVQAAVAEIKEAMETRTVR